MDNNLLSKKYKLKLFKKNDNALYSFNPSIFKYNDKIYALIRNETNVFSFYNSILSYNLLELDINLNLLNTLKLKIKINDSTEYFKISRPNIDNIPIIEDIKIYSKPINNQVIGVCNVLLEKNIIRVGIVEIDVINESINLIKILEIENIKNKEKNWLLFENNNQYYFIYQLFPSLIIYKLDNNTYLLTKIFEKHTFNILKNHKFTHNIYNTYKNLYFTPCSNIIELTKNIYLIIIKKRTLNNIYEYYYIILTIINDNFSIHFIDNKIIEGQKLYLNDIKIINNQFIECWGINDRDYKIRFNKIQVNLLYNETNYEHQIYKFIIEKLINNNKYELIFNQKNIPINITLNDLYLQLKNDSNFIFAYGIDTYSLNKQIYNNANLIVMTIRGPLSREYLSLKSINISKVYGDIILLLSKFYEPLLIPELTEKIGIISLNDNYIDLDKNIYYLINPLNDWINIIDSIYSCKYIISSSLYGLICADTYNKQNLWLDEENLKDNLNFRDYFRSQNRKYINIKNIYEFDKRLLYTDGNNVNLDNLINEFPFL